MSVLPHVVARYRCSTEFPPRIPEMLSSRGFSVSTGRWMANAKEESQEFGFVISDRTSSVNLTGGMLGDGRPAFLLATIPTWQLWGYGKRNAFYQRVHEALINSGAEVWRDYEKSLTRRQSQLGPSGRVAHL